MSPMSIASLNSSTSALSPAQLADTVQVSVLKQAMNQDAQGVLLLLNAMPTVPTPNLPDHLGQNINTVA
jgi:hypothetical protein